jgi:protein-S-isoprenylcysteine O-methyltransferase Ste14
LFSPPGWVVLGGFVLWLLSIALFIASVVLLWKRGKPKKGWEETTELSTGGLHGLVRHPMQLGVVLAALGIVLMKPAAPVVILCVPPAVLGVRAACAEDAYNTSKFGGRYLEYMKTVPRLNLALGIWRRISRRGRA